MPEQIAHKKSSGNHNSNKDKRLLLKEFYKLDAKSKEALLKNNSDNNESNPNTELIQSNGNVDIPLSDDVESDNEDTLEITNLEKKPMNELEFKDLLHIHNRLLRKETDTNNSIKNVIYDNYYDLIKVNDLLKELTEDNHTKLEQLKNTLEDLIN